MRCVAASRPQCRAVQPEAAAEVALAKRRLRLEGEGLQAQLELLRLPITRATRHHPWWSLLVATAGGAGCGWLDDVSGGRLHRLAFRGVGPLLRTLIRRSSLRGL